MTFGKIESTPVLVRFIYLLSQSDLLAPLNLDPPSTHNPPWWKNVILARHLPFRWRSMSADSRWLFRNVSLSQASCSFNETGLFVLWRAKVSLIADRVLCQWTPSFRRFTRTFDETYWNISRTKLLTAFVLPSWYFSNSPFYLSSKWCSIRSTWNRDGQRKCK